MIDQLQKKKINRFKMLETLYKAANGSQKFVGVEKDIIQNSELYPGNHESDFQYLVGEGLIKRISMDGYVMLTHGGIIEYEDAISNPEQSTDYFPAINVINNVIKVSGGINNSQIQQASSDNVQGMTQNNEENLDDLKLFLEIIKTKLPDLELNGDLHSDVEAEIGTIEAQLKVSKPKKSIIDQCLRAIKLIIMEVGTTATATLLLERLSSLLG